MIYALRRIRILLNGKKTWFNLLHNAHYAYVVYKTIISYSEAIENKQVHGAMGNSK